MTRIATLSETRDNCHNCRLRTLCLPDNLPVEDVGRLAGIVQRRKLVSRGTLLFQAGQRFNSIYAVRTGAVKTTTLMANGDEHISGFHLPGEVIGLDAIVSRDHPSTAVALETASVCEIPYAELENLSDRTPALQHQLMRIMSRELLAEQSTNHLLTRRSAEQRLALSDLSFLVTTALDARKRSLDLERMASTDHLTGIANRARFEASLQAELARARRTGTPVSLICLDLNGFKEVNDTHGHSAGDEVLVEVTRRIQQLVREGDTFARLGGDEFAIVIQNARDNAVQSLLSRIAPTVAKPIQLSGGNRVQVTTSVGVATTVEEDLSGDNLLARADADLYRDKNSRGVG